LLLEASKSDPSLSSLAPALGAALVGAVGFTTGGVAAGSLAATILLVVYNGSSSTCGLFLLLQSAGATIAPSVITDGLGAGTTAADVWFGFRGGSSPSAPLPY